MVLALLLAASIAAPAQTLRSKAVRAEFQRAHPCPSTGKAIGPCPHFVADHIIPLCAGGADAASNLQWQSIEDAKAKDKEELRECRALRR